MTTATAGLPGTVFGDLQHGLRQIENLAGLILSGLKPGSASLALRQRQVLNDVLRSFGALKRGTLVSGNTPHRSLTLLTQRTRFAQTIRSRRLGGVGTVLGRLGL